MILSEHRQPLFTLIPHVVNLALSFHHHVDGIVMLHRHVTSAPTFPSSISRGISVVTTPFKIKTFLARPGTKFPSISITIHVLASGFVCSSHPPPLSSPPSAPSSLSHTLSTMPDATKTYPTPLKTEQGVYFERVVG
eukprot:767198-Hanusia_phi.AAC.5